VFADSLPASVRVDQAGQLEASTTGRVVALLVLPTLLLASNALLFALRLALP
jgi:hypothetical protein